MNEDLSRGLIRAFASVVLITSALLFVGGSLLLLAGNDTLLARAFGPQTRFMEIAVNIFDTYTTTSAILLLIMAVLYLVTGIGLWFMQNWARALGVVVSIISLFGFPFGTLLGLFGLGVLVFGNEGFKRRQVSSHHQAAKEIRWR